MHDISKVGSCTRTNINTVEINIVCNKMFKKYGLAALYFYLLTFFKFFCIP